METLQQLGRSAQSAEFKGRDFRATKLHQLDRQSQQHRPWPHSLHGLLKIWGPLASPPKFPGLQETIELKRQTVHRTTPSSLEPSELDKLLAARLKSRYTYHFERTLKNRVSICTYVIICEFRNLLLPHTPSIVSCQGKAHSLCAF